MELGEEAGHGRGWQQAPLWPEMVGPCRPEQEGEAAQAMHRLLGEQDMCVVNMFIPEVAVPACFSVSDGSRASRIDFIAVPRSALPILEQARVLRWAEKQLQLIRATGPPGHRAAGRTTRLSNAPTSGFVMRTRLAGTPSG